MTLNVHLHLGGAQTETEFGTTKFGDGVLLGKLVDAFLKLWPIIAPILLKDGETVVKAE